MTYSESSGWKNQRDEFPDEGDEYFEPDETEEEEKPKGPLSKMPRAGNFRPAVLFVILCYIASVLYGQYPIGEKLWASGETVLKSNEYWRLATSLFVHSDMTHLISNAFVLLLFGWLLRAYFGFFIFPVLSLLAGIAVNYITISMYEPQVRLIGASGMNYAMVGLWLIFYMRYDTDHRLAVRILRSAGFFLALMFPASLNPETSYSAHAIGFAVGIVIGFILLPVVKPRELT